MILYVFGQLREDGSCYNPLAYSFDKSFVEGFARSYATTADRDNTAIVEMDVEVQEYDPSKWEPKCVSVTKHGSYALDLPLKEVYPYRIVVFLSYGYLESSWILMPKSSTEPKGLGHGFVLTPKKHFSL